MKKIRAFIELCKMRVSLSVSFSTATGFILSRRETGMKGFLTAAAVFVLACGASSLNHYQERDTDALMDRTKDRPVPAGTLSNLVVLSFACLTMLCGLFMLYLAGGRFVLYLGLFAVLWYNGVYTFLKKRSSFAAVYGALTGAVPPAIGWISAGGPVSDYRLMLLCFFFFMWQVPHSWVLLAIYGNEHSAAGLPSLKGIFEKKLLPGIIFNWMLSLSVSCILICFSGIVGSTAMKVSLVCVSAWIIWGVAGLLLRETSKEDYRVVFKRINIYMLSVMSMLAADRLFR